MKIKIKQLGLCAILGVATVTVTSCNDLLDREPISQGTPDSYFGTADQLAAYLNNYYNTILTLPYNGSMYHTQSYSDGMAQSDKNTDIFVQSIAGNNGLFADNYWEVPTRKNIQDSYFAIFRAMNYFLEKAEPKYEAGSIIGSSDLVKNYIGEAYFMRAISYFKALVVYGDFPIITTVLSNNNAEIIEASKRAPRNEVARFILSDLDKAIEMLSGRSTFNGQRLNKQAAQLFKSRVALYEGTFEKYHKGSGRVPGDSNWPGSKASYNTGKTFNINTEISFFLSEAMKAAKEVADNAQLTANSHVINPVKGVIYGWNSYFEMFSQPPLGSISEVLLWKEYSKSENIKHSAPYRTKIGCADGYTRVFVESFLMKNGLPIYASSDYQGDSSIDKVKTGCDERLQLFVWGESDMLDSDPAAPNNGKKFVENSDFGPSIISSQDEKRCITGYQPRKYYT